MTVSSLPRFVRQPGPPETERMVAIAAGGSRFDLKLDAGLPLLEAVHRGFTKEGFESGACDLDGVTLARLSYCIPALSKTPDHVAFYSDTYRPAGPTMISRGTLTFGRRDAAPFFHAHALWREADGKIMGGHILPEQTFLAKPTTVRAIGLSGALFDAGPDAETGFKIFSPVIAPAAPADGPFVSVFAIRLRPNSDFCGSLEKLCAAHGISHAVLRGGVGSTIGVRFDDGREAPNFATEIFVREGRIAPGADGRPEASVDVGLIDYQAQIFEGRFKRGDNPVLITFEIILETDRPWPA